MPAGLLCRNASGSAIASRHTDPEAGDGSAEESEQLVVETICNGGSTSRKAMIKEDKVELTSIFGAYGPFQRIVFLFAVTISMFGAYHNLIITAVAPKIDHWCARPPGAGFDNLTNDEWKQLAIPKEMRQGAEHYSHCEEYDFETNTTVRCNSWEYDHSHYKRTVVDQLRNLPIAGDHTVPHDTVLFRQRYYSFTSSFLRGC
ncbi:hypothetical protein HPB52_025623 [Rhipicephalus sanguineus]|uniref:Uncharacterized protein n=1 Tax=Rhipicephalus sanguineus TaxID=34632 RepID=A0A9D4YR82_RHISA|nr:hypothetical protein HPB52_025623 [Rhipicephalus sanguineus]